jgi:hypothetical protein
VSVTTTWDTPASRRRSDAPGAKTPCVPATAGQYLEDFFRRKSAEAQERERRFRAGAPLAVEGR